MYDDIISKAVKAFQACRFVNVMKNQFAFFKDDTRLLSSLYEAKRKSSCLFITMKLCYDEKMEIIGVCEAPDYKST